MANNWNLGNFADIAEVVMGQSPAGKTCNAYGKGSPLLNGPTEFGVYHPFPVQYTTDPKKFAEAGDILFCVRGSTTGRMNWADRKYAIGRGIAAIRHRNGQAYQPFLRAVVDHKLATLLVSATGSTFPNVSRNQLLDLEVEIPPLAAQRAIARILGSLDDKIELNRRMNETLEAMAQALFKSWFVDFDPVIDNARAAGNPIPEDLQVRAASRESLGDARKPLPDDIRNLFPSEFGFIEEMGWIPKGWKIRQIEDIAEKVAMGPFGSSIKVATFVPSGVPIISGQHLNHTLLEDNTHNFITEEHADKLRNSNVFRGDIVFTHAGNIGQVAYIPKSSKYGRYVLSQRQFYLRCDTSQITPLYLIYYFRSAVGQHQILANTSSTGVPSISRPVTYLKTIQLLCPPKDLGDVFSHFISDNHERMGELSREIKTLTDLRDTLLPKLVSGRIRIPEAEKLVQVTV